MKWPSCKLSDLSESITYGHTASARESTCGPKFLRITDIQGGDVNWDTVPYCECTATEAGAAKLQPGDIVFARTGATTGKSFLIRECPHEAVFASYLIRVRPKRLVEPSFLAHFFQSESYWSQIQQSMRGVAQPGVNATTLSRLRVPLPPLAEQQRIAAILDKAEALQAKRRQALAKLDTLTQSLFLEMFGDPARNPKHWQEKPAGELADKFSDGPFGSNLKTEHYQVAGVRVIRLQNIGINEFINADKAYITEEHANDLRKHECLPGDVIVATLGDPNLRACVQPPWLKCAINKADCVQIRPNTALATAEYISALLNMPSLELKASSLILGQTRSRIAMGRLRSLVVPVPPIELQRRFSTAVSGIETERSRAKTSMGDKARLFTVLQHRAFRGEL